jgi:hypothetical protein
MTASPFRTLALAATLMAATAGCNPPEGPPPSDPAPAASAAGRPLASSLHVEAAADSVGLTFSITNVTEAPLPLTFNSGQAIDFSIHRGSEELWRWSANRMFTQAIREESLAPGETKVYTATWQPPAGTRGPLTARAELKDRTHRPRPSTTFTLP